jgi:hypothetical protein
MKLSLEWSMDDHPPYTSSDYSPLEFAAGYHSCLLNQHTYTGTRVKN